MHSHFPDFEYDIFISYRHNDNRSGWVTEFVNALQEELAATIKEPLSIYFDKNPHDGLLETHDVGGSLKEKIKCLVFIPIVSQTYCDPKSFAWQHEFQTFKKAASEDELGIKVKLPGGNVASRILPVSIHEIENEDKTLLEQELGGNIRGIEFIYKCTGVSRPLKANEEDSKANLNHTFYHDQINKVARAIKELINGIQGKTGNSDAVKPDEKKQKVLSATKRRIAIISSVLIVLALVGYAIYYFGNWEKGVEISSDKSIAVLPFVNMSNDPDQEYFSDGMTEEILNQLSKITDLRVTSRTSIMGYKGTTKNTRLIASELGVATVLEGSVRQAGNVVRITVNLVDAANDVPIWSEVYDKKLDDVFAIQSSIATNVAERLKIVISPEVRQQIEKAPTENLDAYNLYLEGAHILWHKPELRSLSKTKMQQAIALDSNFAPAYSFLARIIMEGAFFGNEGTSDAKQLALPLLERAMEINDQDFFINVFMANYHWWLNWDFKQAERYLLNAAKINPSSVGSFPAFANFYFTIGNYAESRKYTERCVKDNPTSILSYECLKGFAYDGQSARGTELANRALELFGSNPHILEHACFVFIHSGNYQKAVDRLEPSVAKIQTGSTTFVADHIGYLAYAYIQLGQIENANELLNILINGRPDLGYNIEYNKAVIYTAKGEIENAFNSLELALKRREVKLIFLNGDLAFKNLHSDQRWKQMLNKIGFP